MKKVQLGALVLGAAGAVGIVGLPAQAMAASSTGFERFTLVISSTGPGPVQEHGAFNAQGTDVEHQSSGRTGSSTFRFPNGNLMISHTDDRGGTSTFNNKSCVGRITASGDYVITGGTGAYDGVTGHGEYTVSGTVITAKTSSGCGKSVLGELLFVQGSGPITLGS
jgi:hypothetical protein